MSGLVDGLIDGLRVLEGRRLESINLEIFYVTVCDREGAYVFFLLIASFFRV